jgi:hypothetical protein
MPWMSSSGSPSPRRSTCSRLPATGTLGIADNAIDPKDHMTGTIDVLDRGRLLAFSFDDMLKYHGPGSPGGVAQAFKILERGLPLVSPDGPPERREIHVRTAFGGPGARDAFELVMRGVTGERYVVDPSLARPERGRAMERFVFEFTYRDRSATLIVREGIVPDEFIALARTDPRSEEQEERFAQLKLEMVERLMALPADEVYDVVS